LEEFRYHVNNRPDLSAELSLYKDPAALSMLGFPVSNFTSVELPSQFVFVTAADDRFFHVAMDAVALVQTHFPNNSIYFYDLSDGVLDIKTDKVNSTLLFHFYHAYECFFKLHIARYKFLMILSSVSC